MSAALRLLPPEKPQEDPFSDYRVCGLDDTGIAGSNIAVPRGMMLAMGDKWKSNALYAVRAFESSTGPRGEIFKHSMIRAYGYNPFHPGNDPGYEICPVFPGKRGRGVTSLSDSYLSYLGEGASGKLVWLGMMEFAEIWGFSTWKAYWMNNVPRLFPDPADQKKERKLLIESFMTPKELAFYKELNESQEPQL